MLQSLNISNFRGIRQGEIEGFGRVNILIGPNGSGKSTILEAINLVASEYFGQDLLQENRVQRIVSRRHESNYADNWWYGRKTDRELTLTVRSESEIVTFRFAKTPQGSMVHDFDKKPKDVLRLYNYLKGLLFFDAERALSAQADQHLWDKAFLGGGHRKLVQQLNSIYSLNAGTISFTGTSGLMVDLDPIPLRLDDLGAGMRIAFRILVAALIAEDSALLLEEFDAYQHKTSMDKLAGALCAIAEQKRVQLFLTTHSLENVHAFLKAAESQDRPSDWLKVYPLSLTPEGLLATRGMSRNDTQGLLDYGVDIRDITSYAQKS